MSKYNDSSRPEGIVTVQMPAHAMTPSANVGEFWTARLSLSEAMQLTVDISNQVNEISAGWAARSRNPKPPETDCDAGGSSNA